VIVEVVGELDLATAPLLDEVLLRAGAVATGRVVVDVSHLTFMGAAGLSVLVGAHYRLLTKDETIRARLPCADLRSWWRDTVTEWSRNGRGLLVAGPSSWPSCSSRRWCQWWRLRHRRATPSGVERKSIITLSGPGDRDVIISSEECSMQCPEVTVASDRGSARTVGDDSWRTARLGPDGHPLRALIPQFRNQPGSGTTCSAAGITIR
jgi:hypothetical protein